MHERPALLRVAAHARLVVTKCLRNHARSMRPAPGRDRGTVGVVTIGAFHRTFIHAVLEGHVEPRANLLMARIAELALPVRQQRLGPMRIVNRMAAGTADLARKVGRTLNMQLAEIGRMAFQAETLRPRRRQRIEADDQVLVEMDYVQARRSVASLAARALGRLVGHGDGREVRIASEALGNLRMTALADSAAEKLLAG